MTTQWPSRRAIAVVEAMRLHPLIVEATSDGWIVVTPLSYWREDAEAVPTMRLHLAPEDVRAWTTAVRGLGTPAADSTAPIHDIPLPQLGRGRVHLAPHLRIWRGSMMLNLVDCNDAPTSIDMSQSDLIRFAAELERATEVARRAPAHASPPTLTRPYYGSEVRCGAELREARIIPSFPHSVTLEQRRYTEVGVRFIVDTAGVVESGSLAVLRGAPDAYARATEDLVRGWRFRPAEFSGSPVRQIMTTVVAFDPADVARRNDPDRILSHHGRADAYLALPPWGPLYVLPESGWVHIALGHWRSNGAFYGLREWLSPDSVDAWVARASRIIAADSTNPKYPRSAFAAGKGPGTPLDPDPMSFLRRRGSNWLTVQYGSSYTATERLRLIVLMSGCSGSGSVPITPLDRRLLERLTAAARTARRYRPSAPSLARPYGRGEVACRAVIPPNWSNKAGSPVAERFPHAPYPAALSRKNVRAEVLASFEVDTSGTPIAETLDTAPGSDPRAVAALRQTIDHVRFSPAFRSGSKVRARVIRTWLFEPPPVCSSEDDGIDCPRRYSRGP